MKLALKMAGYFQQNKKINSVLLGGSRSKGYATEKSDYDFFIIVCNDDFKSFKKTFSSYLECCQFIDQAAYYGYVENWGYIFKAIGFYHQTNVLFDISILPINRIDEMALRSSNILLYDRDKIAESIIQKNSNNFFECSVLEPLRKLDYIKLFGFESLRFESCLTNNDLWLAVKSLERMKQYYMHYKRISEKKFANNPHCPEKQYEITFPNDSLNNIYKIATNLNSLNMVKKDLCYSFWRLVEEKEIIERFIKSPTEI